MWCSRNPFLSHHWEKMSHKHQLQSDGPDQLSSSCSPAGKQCFFAEKPYKKSIRKNKLLNSKKVAFKPSYNVYKDGGRLHLRSDGRMMWGKGNDWAPQHISVCFKWDAFSPAHFDPGETELGKALCAPTIFAEQGGRVKQRPVTHSWNKWAHGANYTASFTNKSWWVKVKVQKFRFCVTGSGQLPSNLQIAFFLFSRKSRRLFCRWTLQRKCLRSPIIVVGSLPSCTFHHGFFLAWLKHRVPKRPIWSCQV